jgi:hypothetical protein
MSKRVEIAILVVLSLVFGFAFLSICDQTVVPLLAKGSGPGGVTVAPSGWLQLIITGLGAGGFSPSGLGLATGGRIPRGPR